MKRIAITTLILIISHLTMAQNVSKTMLRLPDTGETTSYTNTFGEDNDFNIFPPFFTVNGVGTVTDTITGLMWQQADGGEMTIENAILYCDTLTLGGYTDWRLPTAHESFSILNHQHSNPALDLTVFVNNSADYWWTSTRQINDTTKIWVTNAGGGIGNHPKTETISAGGVKRFNVRAVRDVNTPVFIPNHFTDNGDGTITDNLTNLIWQKTPYVDSLTWEDALTYADSLTFAGYTDWRLPNIKEMQSINDENLIGPSINTTFFNNIGINKYWSSTTLPNQTTKAWYLHTQFGITTYDLKTAKDMELCVRGNMNNSSGLPNINAINKDESAFPNPFSSTIKLKAITDNENYILYDSYGQIIFSGRNIEQHDFSELSQGIYILRIIGDKSYVVKVIKG